MDNTWWRAPDEVDEDQMAVYSSPLDGRFLVTGPPGSGKTNVLLLRAVYLTRAGRANLRVLTFGRTLTEFIRSGADSGGKLPSDRVQTVADWELSLYRALTGKRVSYSSDEHDVQRQERLEQLSDAVKKAGLTNAYYDCLLVDEVQDLWDGEVELISKLSKNLFFVGDSRQRIYDRNEGIAAARRVGCKELKLRYHYRIGKRICQVADRILPDPDGIPLSRYSQYDNLKLPATAERRPTATRDAQLAMLVARVETQVRAYPGEWIGIITPRNRNLAPILSAFERSSLRGKVSVHTSDDRQFDPACPIVVLTAHSAKGTEFRAVHLFAAEDFGRHYTREVAFTVVTRAKTSLDVYHTDPIDGSLQAALSPERIPDPKEVF